MNSLIFFSYPDLKFALHPESKRNATRAFAYLSGCIDLHNKQKYICICSILILYVGYTWNTGDSSRLTRYFCLPEMRFPSFLFSAPAETSLRKCLQLSQYTLLLSIRSHIANSQTACFVFWGTKGIYLHSPCRDWLRLFPALISNRYLQFQNFSTAFLGRA